MNSVHFVDPYEHINPMENNNESMHLVNSNEYKSQNKNKNHEKNNKYFYAIGNAITEDKLDQIQPDLDHNSPSPTMNLGLINIYQNEPYNCI